MAFVDQVQDLTSLTVSDTDELSQFLKYGVLDVTNRWLSVKPQDVELFQRESSIIDSNSGLDLGGAKIISVIREAGADGSSDGSTAWEVCRKIPASMQSRVVDTESLHYASKYNPAYIIDDNGKVNVYPVASSNNGYRVFFVNNVPTDETNEVALIHSHSDVKWFPNDKVYLVVMYAGMRVLHAAMGATTITDLTVTVVPPDAPLTPSFSAASVSAVTNRAISASAPTYDNTIASSEFGDLATLIDTDEDVELATAKVQEINALIQNELNEFNEANILFQATIQRETQEDTLILQKYQADLAVYQAEVGAQVQEYTQKLQRGTQQYQLDIQNELNEFNKENARYQANIQAEIAKFQVDAAEAQKEGDLEFQARIQDYTQELALFGGEVQKYQAETQSAVQTMQGTVANNQALLTKYQAEIAEYQAEVAAETQEQSVKMQHYQLLYTQLKAEYDAAFMIAAPKQQPQQQVRA